MLLLKIKKIFMFWSYVLLLYSCALMTMANVNCEI